MFVIPKGFELNKSCPVLKIGNIDWFITMEVQIFLKRHKRHMRNTYLIYVGLSAWSV